jgi:predicted nucleic acid-binding protein
MAIAQYRVFFDTSVYIAALISPCGAAAELIRLAETLAIRMVVSEVVIVESDKVLAEKFPELIQESRRLWKHLEPEIAPDPLPGQIKPFLQTLPKADACILCAASLANVSAFVTWNTRDFMVKGIQSLVAFPIVVPADCLALFRKSLDPFLEA